MVAMVPNAILSEEEEALGGEDAETEVRVTKRVEDPELASSMGLTDTSATDEDREKQNAKWVEAREAARQRANKRIYEDPKPVRHAW